MDSDGRDLVLMKKGKNQSVFSNFNQLLLTFHYDQQTEIDFLAIYKSADPEKYGLVYFGDLGSLSEFPYMLLENEPNTKVLRIVDFSNIQQIWLIALDYESVLNASPSSMTDGSLNVVDDLDNEYNFEYSFDSEHNLYVFGRIDNLDQTQFFNLETACKLEKFEKLSDLLDCIEI